MRQPSRPRSHHAGCLTSRFRDDIAGRTCYLSGIMDRNLWIAVVFQARDDLDTEDYASVEYGEAVAFFTNTHGSWAQSRQDIADHLGLHSDDLTRMGRAVIAARHLRDGPEPVIERAVGSASHSTSGLRSRPATLTTPVPCLTNPAPVVPFIAARKPRERRDRQWWINQFLTRQAA